MIPNQTDLDKIDIEPETFLNFSVNLLFTKCHFCELKLTLFFFAF